MFTIAQTPSYKAAVSILMPGEKAPQTFDVELKRLTKPEILSLNERIRAGDITDRDVCHQVVLGWKGVQDEGGELEFTVGNLNSLLDIHPVEQSIINALFSSLAGVKQKN